MRERLFADVAVVGLGPAGVAAAVRAAEAGARVIAVDLGLRPGGQIWRHRGSPGSALPRTAREWLSRLERASASGCRLLLRTTVVDAEEGRLQVAVEGRPLQVEAKALVLASGARERFLPFPGWTLPGNLGVGGAQALVKSGGEVRGLRVVVAGTGPLLLPVAATLARAGARVATIAEQAPWTRVAGFAAGLLRHPGKLLEAVRYRSRTASSAYAMGTWVRTASGRDRVESVTVTDGRRERTVPCDILACGYGLVPSLEVARLLGVRLLGEAVEVDPLQRTSIDGVLAAGEVCGVGGADLALVEGEIAGLVAAGLPDAAAALLPRRDRRRGFAQRLEAAFSLRPELRSLPASDTILCRCEGVAFGRVRGEWTPRQAKLYTRTGMGPCQGRVCGAACTFLFGWPADLVRPPLFPVPLAALMEADS